MKRGEIWWTSLSVPAGSEPGFRRPVVIISSNDFNRSRIRTIIAAVITSNLRLADAPGNILLPRKSSKLAKDSVINVSQIITIDKSFLDEKVSSLNPKVLSKLSEGLQLVLAI